MAFSNPLTLISWATCALVFVSLSSPTPVNALSVHAHGSRISSAHNVLAKRATKKRCKPRSASNSTTGSTTSSQTHSTAPSVIHTTSSHTTSSSENHATSTSSKAPQSTGSSGGNSGGSDGVIRGLAWATDDSWISNFANTGVEWAYHWADGRPKGWTGPFYPMYWGTSNYASWAQRKKEIDSGQESPQYIIAFNEPDLDSQANMDPKTAANEYIKELLPYGKKGIKLVSPAVAWDLDWLADFETAVQNQGGWIDVVALHWYGDFRNIQGLKDHVTDAFNRFGKKAVWLTEVGITTQSGPSTGDVQNFLSELLSWGKSSGMVARVAWFGCFPSNKPIDNFASADNAFFTADGGLNALGKLYAGN